MIRFFDGGMGSMLNLAAGELPEKLNISEPERVFAVHKGYADAGAEFITANTFGANSLKYDNVDELVKAGVALAKKAGKYVALDIGPTGKLLKPMGDLEFERAVELFAEVVRAGKDGSDVAIIETMSDMYELKAAVIAVKENSDLPIITSMIFDESGRLLTGGDVKSAVAMLEGCGCAAAGLYDAQPAQPVYCRQRGGVGPVYRDRGSAQCGGWSAHPQLHAGLSDLCRLLCGADGTVPAAKQLADRSLQRSAQRAMSVHSL